eukprot:g40765.t1
MATLMDVCSLEEGMRKDRLILISTSLGGYCSNGRSLRTVERYDPVKNECDLVAAMKTARWAFTATVLNRNLYAIGGYDVESSTSVERYDPVTNRWEDVAPLTRPRAFSCSAVLDGSLYVMGGAGPGELTASVERYDPSRNCWQRVSDMTSARAYASCGSLEC